MPTAEEVCGDGVDNNCDTAIDAYYTSNQPPTIDGALSVVNADGEVPLFSDDLTASNAASSDVEGDDVLLQYDWRKGGDSFATYNANFDVDELCSVSEKSTWNHIGTKYGSVTFSDGYRGKALEFNGTQSHVQLSGANLMSGTFSVAMWVQFTNVTDVQSIISQSEDPSVSIRNEHFLYVHDGKLRYQVYSDNEWPTGVHPTAITTDTWYHVAVTHKGTDVGDTVLYVNGVPAVVDKSIPDIDDGDVYLGSEGFLDFDGGGRYLNGKIDEVLAFDKALSEEQIKSIYDNNYSEIVFEETQRDSTWSIAVTANDTHSYGVTAESNAIELNCNTSIDDCDGFIDDDCDNNDVYTFPGAAELDSDSECMTDADEDGRGDLYVDTAAGIVAGTDCDDSNDALYAFTECENWDFQSVSSGIFTMGSPDDEIGRDSDEDRHEVTLTQDFEMMVGEVTQEQFLAVTGYNPSSFTTSTEFPVEGVNWHEAAHFSNLLSEMEGRSGCYDCTGSGSSVLCDYSEVDIYSCEGYRLPTEAEWEYSVRGGEDYSITLPQSDRVGALSTGQTTQCNSKVKIWNNNYQLNWIANYCYPSGNTSVVSNNTNPFGFSDMYGNVTEWIHDSYTETLTTNSVANPVHENSADERVLRGGSWFDVPALMRSASREFDDPTTNSDKYGIRVVRSLP